MPGSLLFIQVALGSAPGLYRQCVCEVMIERYLAFKKLGFLERQSTVSSFSFQVLFQTRSNPAWVSRIQTQTRRIALRTITETPEVYAVCTVGGDDVCTLPFKKLGFLAVQMWPIFLLKYSLTQALLEIQFR